MHPVACISRYINGHGKINISQTGLLLLPRQHSTHIHEASPSCSQHMEPSFSSSSRQKLGDILASILSSPTLQANHQRIPGGSTSKCTRDLTPDHTACVALASGPSHSHFLPHCYKSILTNLASSLASSPLPPLHLFSTEPARVMPLKCKSDYVILQLKISL